MGRFELWHSGATSGQGSRATQIVRHVAAQRIEETCQKFGSGHGIRVKLVKLVKFAAKMLWPRNQTLSMSIFRVQRHDKNGCCETALKSPSSSHGDSCEPHKVRMKGLARSQPPALSPAYGLTSQEFSFVLQRISFIHI